jgi:hypothetical protein
MLQVSISGGRMTRCVGGVWLWDAAHAVLRGAELAGGPSHALLADGGASVDAEASVPTCHCPAHGWVVWVYAAFPL